MNVFKAAGKAVINGMHYGLHTVTDYVSGHRKLKQIGCSWLHAGHIICNMYSNCYFS